MSIEQTSNGAAAPNLDIATSALLSNPHDRLRRASEIEREEHPDAPLARIVRWVREFLARSHPDLGRSGPVCPFTPIALGLDTLWFTEVPDEVPDAQRVAEIVATCRERFLELEPRSGPGTINKSLLIVFPKFALESAAVVDAVQSQLKQRFVEIGLMLGEFHGDNRTPGLRNAAFFPLRSPVPMLVIRHMVESDLPFMRRSSDAPGVRAAYLRAYLRRLAASMSRNSFEQALEALVEAEMQMRSEAGANAAPALNGCPVHHGGGNRVSALSDQAE